MNRNFFNLFTHPVKQVLKIAIYGDSIFASGFKDRTYPDGDGLGPYEQPPRNCHFDSIQRRIYDYLDYNKPVFRSALHADWTYSGGWAAVQSSVEPRTDYQHGEGVLHYEKLMALDEGNEGNAQIQIKGHKTVVFIFEGGSRGIREETGYVKVTVSVDGCKFTEPSELLKGKIREAKNEEISFGNQSAFEEALDEFDTSFENPSSITPDNRCAPMIELFYNGLDPSKEYTFRIAKPDSAKAVKLWGCYYFTGQTLLVHNESKPGLSWNELYESVYTDLKLSDTDVVILEAPMYHDRSLNEAERDSKRLINSIQSYGMKVILCSCTPGGITPTGRKSSIPGDAESCEYAPGENLYITFNQRRIFNTTDIECIEGCPARGSVYEIDVSGRSYRITCADSKQNTSVKKTSFTVPEDMPDPEFPLNAVKLSGIGQEKILYRSVNPFFTVSRHRDLMCRIAGSEHCIFIDLFQGFRNLALLMGEDLDCKGYEMGVNHPLYSECVKREMDGENYPVLKKPFRMNYMTNFFDLEDSHHLEYPAHDVIFNCIKPIIARIDPFDSSCSSAAVSGGEPGKTDFIDILMPPFEVSGFSWFKDEKVFCRLPQKSLNLFSAEVRQIAWSTAGGMVRFKTDSPKMAVRVELRTDDSLAHMALTGTSGCDFYLGCGSSKQFVRTVTPGPGQDRYECVVIDGLSKDMREWTVNFPLYNGVKILQIGLASGSKLEKPEPFTVQKPLLFYGSSITQGLYASRPGNAYTHIISRWLDAGFINLGFSGSAKGEGDMAELIASLELSAFIMDYDHNAPNVQYLAETHEPFFRIIRNKRPDLPVIFVSRPDYDNDIRDGELRRQVVYDTYRKASDAGDRNVYFVDGQALFGDDDRDACTVDGCHPNDLGFMRMAGKIHPVVRMALNYRKKDT